VYAEHSGVDIEQMVIDLHEPLDVPAFRQAWQGVVGRHDVLRTSFNWEDFVEPLQLVHTELTVPFKLHDLRSQPAADQDVETRAYLRADRRRGFDLREAPLMRLALFWLGDAEFRLIWTFHHILIDGRSFVIVLKEVSRLYEAALKRERPDLPLPRRYREYIDWLGKLSSSAAEGFWREKLKGFKAPTSLPVDREAAGRAVQEDLYTSEETRLSRQLSDELRALAARENLTLNTLLQGAWALLLSVYSGEQDVVFGATKTVRRSSIPGADSIVGLFLNTLPLRVGARRDAPLLPWLRELRAEWVSLREYEHTPLVKIKEWSEIPGGSSLFDSLVVFENQRFDSVLRGEGGSWLNREFRLFEQTNYPLGLVAYGDPEVMLKIEYDTLRFEPSAATRMLGHLGTLLEGMAARPTSALGDLPLLSAAERRQLLVEWNDTQVDYPRNACLHELIEEQAERSPASTALVYERESMSYREMNARSNQLARHLHALGIGPDVCVGLCMERSIEMVLGLLAILKAGGAYVPLDPGYPRERLAFLLEDSCVPVLLTQPRLLESLPAHSARVVCLDSSWWMNTQERPNRLERRATPRNLAYVIYTSGSTGRPKGVQVEHRGLCNLVETQRRTCGVRPDDRVLQFCSLSFDPSIFEIGVALGSGATLVLGSRDALMPGGALAQFLRDQAVTTIVLPPSVLSPLPDERFPSLRTLIVGAEPVTADFVQRWASGRRIFNIYGATETTVFSTTAECAADGRKPSIGRPIANTQVYLLDSSLRPVPVGVPGELYVGGVGVARGYLSRPELTAERFIPDPFSSTPGSRLYRTGDLARFLSDGTIDFLGRVDNQVKVRGHRVELEEIEAVLAEHPAVRQAAVAIRERISGDQRLVAYFVSAEAPAPLANELRSFLKRKLPDYMIPGAFVPMDTLPLSPNGKVDRRALPAPDPKHKGGRTIIGPRDALEHRLKEIWEETLGVRPISVTDDFFELGGHSLLAMTLFARIDKAVGKNLPLTTLFQAPTVAELAATVRQHEWRPPGLVAIQPHGSEPPLFCIRAGLEFRDLALELGPDQPVYGVRHDDILEERDSFTLQEITAEYVKRIRGLQPEGPYYLAGACVSGLFVVEVARLLQAQGESVAFLALFEAEIPRYRPSLSAGKAFWLYNAPKIPFHLRHFLRLGWRARFLYIMRRITNFFVYVRRRTAELSIGAFPTIWRPSPRALRERHLIQLARERVPEMYPGRVTLFRVRRPVGGGHDATLGWGRIATGGVEVYETPGDHESMFKEPNVRALGEQLKVCLAAAQGRGKGSQP
jgi:amino acid adenylation domain-containing protein